MDKLIIILFVIIIIIACSNILLTNKERFGFSNIDRHIKHSFNIKQRRFYDLFVEDDKLGLHEPIKNVVLRDVNELINYESKGKDIYELTRVKPENKNYKNNMTFW
jgi:cell division protein FtsL